jgi:hypothetical protein
MKALKIYLIIVSLLLAVAIGLGIYIWYVLQTIQTEQGTTNPTFTVETVEVADEEPITLTPGVTQVVEPITIDVTTLNDTQRSMLESFGYSKESITITPAMMTCAKEAVGETRFTEIVNGRAPSPLESLSLLPCFKK